MIRPRLRPTLSRRVKYIGIAPQAQRNLGREARRGSHDLRRLVGHANFLDTLVEALDVDDEGDNKTRRPPSPTPQSNLGRDEFEDLEELDEDSDEETDSDNWSDESDDDDHALSRTASAQQLAQASRGVREAMKEDDGDYFSQSRRGEGMIKVDDHSNLDIIDVAKKDAVTVVDSLVELTPMVSPADSQSSDSSRDDADVARKP